MICIDNSEWMRNGDYSPNRFQALADAVNLICGAKTQVLVFLKKSCSHSRVCSISGWCFSYTKS